MQKVVLTLALLAPVAGWGQSWPHVMPSYSVNTVCVWPANHFCTVSDIPHISNNPQTGEIRISLKDYRCKKEYGAMVCTPTEPKGE